MEFAKVLPVFEDAHYCTGYITPVFVGELGQRIVTYGISIQLHALADCQAALGLGLEHADADDADGHQHDREMNEITAITPAVAGEKPPERNKKVLILCTGARRNGAPVFMQRDRSGNRYYAKPDQLLPAAHAKGEQHNKYSECNCHRRPDRAPEFRDRNDECEGANTKKDQHDPIVQARKV